MRTINTKKVLGYSLLFLIPLLTIISSLYVFFNNRGVKGVNTERNVVNQYPYISNLLPKIAYVGEEYVFAPRIVANDIGDVILSKVEGPDWLEFDSENFLRGVPSIDDFGTYKVTLRVQDDFGSSSITEYILVEENE